MQGFKRMLGFGQQSASWRSLLPKATADAPKLYDQLQVLHIANTKLSSVPQAVTQLPNLELLSLTHCSLFVSPLRWKHTHQAEISAPFWICST